MLGLHELAHEAHETTAAAAASTTALALHEHLQCHLCCRCNGVLLVGLLVHIALRALLICRIVSRSTI